MPGSARSIRLLLALLSLALLVGCTSEAKSPSDDDPETALLAEVGDVESVFVEEGQCVRVNQSLVRIDDPRRNSPATSDSSRSAWAHRFGIPWSARYTGTSVFAVPRTQRSP